MKKFLWSTLVTIAGLFTVATGSRAQAGTVVVHIRQDFIAGGKAFPAGTYRVYQDLPQAGQALILRGEEASAFLLPCTHDGAFAGETGAKLTRVGDVYYLSEIVTELGAYTFSIPPALTRTAKASDQVSKAAGGGK
jgi:hypothetical protein